MLKICEQKGVGDEYTVEQYYTLSQLAMDPVKQVRSRFIAKLHKGLARGVPYKCLPLDFLGFYAMVGMETDKTVRDGTKRYMIADINARKDCIKTMTYSSTEITKQLPNIMPDFMLVFAIAVLAHHPEFESTQDIDFLKRIRGALWFVMEPLMAKNDNFSFGFYKGLVEKVKNKVDAIDEEIYNEKLWAVCDLTISLLFSKTTNFELKEFPAKLNLSQIYFKEHSEGENFVNGNTYIPTELIYQPPKKAGAALFITRKPVATASTSSIKSIGKATDDVTKESENDDTTDSSGGKKRTREASLEEENDESETEPNAKKSAAENGTEASNSARPKRGARKVV